MKHYKQTLKYGTAHDATFAIKKGSAKQGHPKGHTVPPLTVSYITDGKESYGTIIWACNELGMTVPEIRKLMDAGVLRWMQGYSAYGNGYFNITPDPNYVMINEEDVKHLKEVEKAEAAAAVKNAALVVEHAMAAYHIFYDVNT